MKKPLFKILLPVFALLLSSCDFFSFFDTLQTKEDTQTNTTPQINIINHEQTPETETKSPYEGYPASITVPESLPLTKGASKTISVSLFPKDAKYQTITWESSNKSVATVVDGNIKGLATGKAVITASTINFKGETITSKCNVVVTDPDYISKRTLLYTYDDYINHNAAGNDSCPVSGSAKLLVVPVWFTNSDEFISLENREEIRNDIDLAFFGSDSDTGWKSLSNYYKEESFGKLTLSGVVTDWYEVGTNYEKYAPSSALSSTVSLMNSAADWYFSKPESPSRKTFDSNSDGYLDGVILVYGAPDYVRLQDKTKSNLWAYTYWDFDNYSNIDSPLPSAFIWASYDFMYSDGADAFAKTDASSYGHGDTRFCSVDSHTFIHEMGHVFGLQDYYDYSGQHAPAGGFSMQDYNVGGHDPYSVMANGWANPYVPSTSTTITINDFQSSHDLILLANHTVNSPFDEYLLLELYTPTGLNEFDTKHVYSDTISGRKETGLRVWHVDARLTQYNPYYGNFSESLITNPNSGNVLHAMSNTYYKDGSDDTGHASYLGSKYSDFNILQLIHSKGNSSEYFGVNSLFGYEASFDMTNYNSQFANDKKMNDGKDLGWTFTVEAIDDSSAAIKLTKL